MTPRLIKVGDALSQLVNVALLPQHTQTTANESISGRAHRLGWQRTARAIDWLFSWWEDEHCRRSHEADLKRASEFLET